MQTPTTFMIVVDMHVVVHSEQHVLPEPLWRSPFWQTDELFGGSHCVWMSSRMGTGIQADRAATEQRSNSAEYGVVRGCRCALTFSLWLPGTTEEVVSWITTMLCPQVNLFWNRSSNLKRCLQNIDQIYSMYNYTSNIQTLIRLWIIQILWAFFKHCFYDLPKV